MFANDVSIISRLNGVNLPQPVIAKILLILIYQH
jgi:hypothetical protein